MSLTRRFALTLALVSSAAALPLGCSSQPDRSFVDDLSLDSGEPDDGGGQLDGSAGGTDGGTGGGGGAGGGGGGAGGTDGGT
ncbi:MAG: hypothetical protein FJ104_01205, partial [Deltaproteobacteria bacterium]|nr:hypothetical protein [Deltaproteobacteria bacterium]